MSDATLNTRPEASRLRVFAARGGLIGAALFVVLAVAVLTGARYGLMLMIGLGFGITLEALRFGFAGPWRAMILRRDPSGLWAQLLAMGLVALVALPLIADNSTELSAAQAPIGFSMVLGAFVFGIAMQVVLGCGSGTLVNAGSGNAVSLVALPFFVLGSFLGSLHVLWWTSLCAWHTPNLTGWTGLAITLVGLFVVAVFLWFLADKSARKLPRRLIWAAGLIAGFAILNLVVSGQPWGVVYGLGLWGAKLASALGADLSNAAFWANPASTERLSSPILIDYTSLTNIGIIIGAFIVASWRVGGFSQPLPKLPARAWIATMVAGVLLGYSARLAFGCNVGAFFSGISTGSLHGWAWFPAAFAGSIVGLRLRPLLGLEPKT